MKQRVAAGRLVVRGRQPRVSRIGHHWAIFEPLEEEMQVGSHVQRRGPVNDVIPVEGCPDTQRVGGYPVGQPPIIQLSLARYIPYLR